MCGIVGLWCFGTSDVAPQRFRSVVRSLAHRGPDGEGAFHDVEARLHLGHRRLAILDPTPAGAQPMSTDDGDLVIVHNGEIYDFVELREELEGLGHRFRTDTDTEVLLAAYREWGEGMLGRLNGMWAFAIWDRAHRRLFAARDRFGVKPFLYHRGAGLFAFASELKAFAALPGFTPVLDAATLVLNPMEMETVGPTLLEGVRSLPPGHLLVMDADGRIEERRWWSTADNLPDVPSTYGEQVEAFTELFADACRIRLRADVPLGTSLSGGLDSSSVVAMVHAVGGQQGFTADWQRVFSQGHLGSDQDESVWAAKVADRIGVPITWTDISVEEELDRLEDSVLAFEGVHFLPLGVWSHYRSLREHGVLISIDGHGGDELLGGYARFPKAMRQRSLTGLRPGSWKNYADTSLGLLGQEASAGGRSALLREDLGLLRSWVAPRSLIGRTSLGHRLRLARRRRVTPSHGGGADREVVIQYEEELRRRVQLIKDEAAGLPPLGEMLYVAFHQGILPSILRNFDRLSMASGIEIRAPLLDWRLVTFANALPDEARIGAGFTKRILRDATDGLLPDDVRLRKDKKGFTSPVLDWLERGIGDRAREIVTEPSFAERPHWDGRAVRDRVTQAHAAEDWRALKNDWSFVQAELLVRGFERISREADARTG